MTRIPGDFPNDGRDHAADRPNAQSRPAAAPFEAAARSAARAGRCRRSTRCRRRAFLGMAARRRATPWREARSARGCLPGARRRGGHLPICRPGPGDRARGRGGRACWGGTTATGSRRTTRGGARPSRRRRPDAPGRPGRVRRGPGRRGHGRVGRVRLRLPTPKCGRGPSARPRGVNRPNRASRRRLVFASSGASPRTPDCGPPPPRPTGVWPRIARPAATAFSSRERARWGSRAHAGAGMPARGRRAGDFACTCMRTALGPPSGPALRRRRESGAWRAAAARTP